MHRNLLSLALLAAFVGGCATHKPTPVPVTEVPAGSFVTAWSAPSDLKKVSKFYLENNTLVAFDPKNKVVGFDTKGALKFQTSVAEPEDVVGPPMVQADRIIFPTSATLEIFTTNGVHLKSLQLKQPLRSPGVAIDQTVYVGIDSETGGRLAAIALDRPYDIYRWTALTQSVIYTRPAVHDNVVFVATENGRVIAINANRSLLWPKAPEMPDSIFHTDGQILSALTADEGGIYVPSTDTKLYCLEPNTGRIRWTYYAGVPVTHSAVPTSDTVYVLIDGQGLVALDKKANGTTRNPRWTYADGKQLLSDDAKNAYVLTNSGTIVALDKATGKVRFESQNTHLAFAATHVDPKDATIFGVTKDWQVVAIKPVLRGGVVGSLALAW